MPFNSEAFGTVVRFGLALVLAYVVWRRMIVSTLNEEFRQTLFELRRELFVAATDRDDLSYDHPAYVFARSLLNGLLLGGEEWTLTRLALVRVANERDSKAEAKFQRDFEARLADLSQPSREKVQSVIARAYVACVKRSIVTSLSAMTFVALALVGLAIVRAVKAKKNAPSASDALVELFPREPVLSDALARQAAAA